MKSLILHHRKKKFHYYQIAYGNSDNGRDSAFHSSKSFRNRQNKHCKKGKYYETGNFSI